MVSAGVAILLYKENWWIVLILIILEDGFCFFNGNIIEKEKFGLNPYYTGRWFLL